MSPAAIGVVVVFLAVGLALGWFSQKARAAHSDVKVAKNRLAGGRRARWRSGGVALIIGVLTLIVMTAVLRTR